LRTPMKISGLLPLCCIRSRTAQQLSYPVQASMSPPLLLHVFSFCHCCSSARRCSCCARQATSTCTLWLPSLPHSCLALPHHTTMPHLSAEAKHHILLEYSPRSPTHSLSALAARHSIAGGERTVRNWLQRWDGT